MMTTAQFAGTEESSCVVIRAHVFSICNVTCRHSRHCQGEILSSNKKNTTFTPLRTRNFSGLHRLCIDTFMVCDAGYLRESLEQEIC